MKTLKTLKLLSISALVVLGMSSCEKIPDPEFGLAALNPYVEQLSDGRFVPYFYVQPTYYANFYIKKATASNGKITYSMSNIGYGCQTSANQSDNKLPEGTYVIKVTATTGETDSLKVTFDLKESQIMGDLVVDSLIYDPSDGIKAGWQAVTNADAYCLAIMPVAEDSEGNLIDAKPSTSFIYWNSEDKKKTSGVFRGNTNIVKGQRYRIAVAALNGKERPNVVILKGESKLITWGEKEK